MTDSQKHSIAALRQEGMSYNGIAKRTGISVNTVKSYCRRCSIKSEEHVCKQCGVSVAQNPGRREKKFCSAACRMKWWNSHTGLMKENAVCAHCAKPFHGRAGRKYCCHACYIAERFGNRHVS